MFKHEHLTEKWDSVINHEGTPEIKDNYRKAVTTVVLENQAAALKEQKINETAANATGAGIANWDPILISLVRRSMPNLMAFDVAGVQPMTGPVGLIFAMKSKYSTQGGTEALHNEADTAFSGTGTHAGDSSSLPGVDVDTDDVDDPFGVGEGMSTADAEALGNTGNAFGEMAFSIEKATVTAKSRALKAEYTQENAQDLKAIHGLEAESELANILSAEILGEINREVIRTINVKAKLGAQDATTAGVFDLAADSDGRWSVERYKGLVVQLERECNAIAKDTRRGKGNFIICSSDVATALHAAGMLDYAPALSTSLNVDDTGSTFAGVLNGRTKVFIDPYAAKDYITVGYRGTNPYDAGMFYCPYVPLTMMRAIGENDFQPRIGFKTRYGMIANPYVGATAGDDTGANRSNQYFRIFRVDNILS